MTESPEEIAKKVYLKLAGGKFKTLSHSFNPEALLECPQCEKQFWVDPVTEEGLVYTYTPNIVLIPQCPQCQYVEPEFQKCLR